MKTAITSEGFNARSAFPPEFPKAVMKEQFPATGAAASRRIAITHTAGRGAVGEARNRRAADSIEKITGEAGDVGPQRVRILVSEEKI